MAIHGVFDPLRIPNLGFKINPSQHVGGAFYVQALPLEISNLDDPHLLLLDDTEASQRLWTFISMTHVHL